MVGWELVGGFGCSRFCLAAVADLLISFLWFWYNIVLVMFASGLVHWCVLAMLPSRRGCTSYDVLAGGFPRWFWVGFSAFPG